MDDVFKLMIDQDYTKADLIAQGINRELIDMLIYRIKANAFKGKLPKIASIDFNEKI
jgi:NAD+ synthase